MLEKIPENTVGRQGSKQMVEQNNSDLKTQIIRLKLSYFTYIIQRLHSLEKPLMLEKVGKREYNQ